MPKCNMLLIVTIWLGCILEKIQQSKDTSTDFNRSKKVMMEEKSSLKSFYLLLIVNIWLGCTVLKIQQSAYIVTLI